MVDAVELAASAGRVSVSDVNARTILTRSSGFIRRYKFTLNPYGGCAFGCGYCYARFFVADADRRDEWGNWISVKQNARELLARACTSGMLRTGDAIYMSSVTDPYQPVERRLRLTRELLQTLLEHGVQPRLTIQTRSPLATRDIDLFQQFHRIRVNFTIGTDSDGIRRRHKPRCPSIDQRFSAAAEVAAAGVPVGCRSAPCCPSATSRRSHSDCLHSRQRSTSRSFSNRRGDSLQQGAQSTPSVRRRKTVGGAATISRRARPLRESSASGTPYWKEARGMRPPEPLDAHTWRVLHDRLDAAVAGAASLSLQRFTSRPFAVASDRWSRELDELRMKREPDYAVPGVPLVYALRYMSRRVISVLGALSTIDGDGFPTAVLDVGSGTGATALALNLLRPTHGRRSASGSTPCYSR